MPAIKEIIRLLEAKLNLQHNTVQDAMDEERAKAKLVSLPAELRNKIYDYVLLSEQHVLRMGQRPHTAIPPILQSSRQLRREALSLFFSEARFEIITPWKKRRTLLHHLRSLPMEAKRCLLRNKNFNVRMIVDDAHPAYKTFEKYLSDYGTTFVQYGLYISCEKTEAENEPIELMTDIGKQRKKRIASGGLVVPREKLEHGRRALLYRIKKRVEEGEKLEGKEVLRYEMLKVYDQVIEALGGRFSS